MTTAPRPPAGVVVERPVLGNGRDELTRWRHATRPPYLTVTFHHARPTVERRGRITDDGAPPRVTVGTFPGPLDGVTDPRELRQCAWTLLAAARWLDDERARLDLPAPEVEPDPQMTIYDALEVAEA